MRVLSSTVAFSLVLCFLAPWLAAKEPTQNAADAQLLGSWNILWVEANGERNQPEGDAALPVTFTAEHIELGKQKVPYTLDTETSPKLIDLKVTIGNEEKRRNLEGIYKLEDGQLMICVYLSNDGSTQRPVEFSTEAGSNRIAVLMERKN